MRTAELSPPKIFEDSDIEEIIRKEFDLFYNSFLKKEVKPKYKGKDIFFNMDRKYRSIQLKRPERFMHIISIEEKNYEIYPCNNDIAYTLCTSQCKKSIRVMDIQCLDRCECIFRLARVHWIPEIIRLANNGNLYVKTWDASERAQGGNIRLMHYIRYEHGIYDYIIIFELNKKKNYYNFITAFPIFSRRHKYQYTKAYKEAMQK